MTFLENRLSSFRLIHSSDWHTPPLPILATHHYFSKRFSGYYNWHKKRKASHIEEILQVVMTNMASLNANHMVVTGDLTNLSLADEINLNRRLIRELGADADISVIPGNHDAYVPTALDRFCETFAPNMQGDAEFNLPDLGIFPYVRKRESVIIIGLSSAIATPPLISAGLIAQKQLTRLQHLVPKILAIKKIPVFLLHHPPIRRLRYWHRGLWRLNAFKQILHQLPFALILHGHSHKRSITEWQTGSGGQFIALGVPSASANGQHGDRAGVNIVDFNTQDSGINIRITARDLAHESLSTFSDKIIGEYHFQFR